MVLSKWQVRYQRIPTNYHDPHNAVVEAEDAETAVALVRRQLGEGNGVRNYVVDAAVPYEEIQSAGRIVTMNG